MEIKDATDILSKALAEINVHGGEMIESMYHAEIDAAYLETLIYNPKAVLKALNIKVSDESQVQVTLKQRAQRDSRAMALRRRILIIVIHYTDCNGDIIIIPL
jgi:hypothetical protein